MDTLEKLIKIIRQLYYWQLCSFFGGYLVCMSLVFGRVEPEDKTLTTSLGMFLIVLGGIFAVIRWNKGDSIDTPKQEDENDDKR